MQQATVTIENLLPGGGIKDSDTGHMTSFDLLRLAYCLRLALDAARAA